MEFDGHNNKYQKIRKLVAEHVFLLPVKKRENKYWRVVRVVEGVPVATGRNYLKGELSEWLKESRLQPGESVYTRKGIVPNGSELSADKYGKS